MPDLAEVIQQASSHHRQASEATDAGAHNKPASNAATRTPPAPTSKLLIPEEDSPPFNFSFDTPSNRTGPPRSLSHVHSRSNTPSHSRRASRQDSGASLGRGLDHIPDHVDDDMYESDNPDAAQADQTSFRGALDKSAGSRANSMAGTERRDKGKKRDTWVGEDSAWNPLKWFYDSPKEEKRMDWDIPTPLPASQGDDADRRQLPEQGRKPNRRGTVDDSAADAGRKQGAPQLKRSRSEEALRPGPGRSKTGLAKWGRLRSLLPQVAQQAQVQPAAQVVNQSVSLADELTMSGLSTLMIRLWMERDEKDHRRVPVLLHRLKIRISDSLHPLQGQRSVFRIECEYANGAARWVIYRQLRDFISLHTHYSLSNAYNRNVEGLPDFPKTSLPYFKFLNKDEKEAKEGKEGKRDKHETKEMKRERHERGAKREKQVSHSDFARLQRKALETYLVDLIRAVMFHPASNRLSGFLEISALFIAHAHDGGSQYKAGFLQIEASGSKGGGFGRKGTSRKEKGKYRWCAVRDSYLAVMEDPGDLTVWDVFMLDSDFKIERPTRYYRQGLHLLHANDSSEKFKDSKDKAKMAPLLLQPSNLQADQTSTRRARSMLGSVRSKFSNIFHRGRGSASMGGHDNDYAESSGSSRSSSSISRPATPMLDPSINVNPILPSSSRPTEGESQADVREKKGKEEESNKSREVSKHTFYIENSQMKLKLYARNERQMLQWITALEKTAATSNFTGGNRFDSFAPIRLNVAAQWLVDGRDYFWNCSRAILLAKETIYIHDWWLSPELHMRRPNMDRYRLDKLLERKAKEGVKIFIILYQEVSSRTTPTDSNYAKQRLMGLHPNIMVQRSPSHFQTGTFYWAHHEKLCLIDEVIAFTGGVDLCFGRWDTPQHILVDEAEGTEEDPQIWPGKDYSNPRVVDFYSLERPMEDMYDRSKVPRMPWHDVGIQIVGQPARDLARHFVQRWNYLLRIKNHSRTMPFLLPPSEFKPGELTEMGLTGTCELQICRSAGPWSLGTPMRIEHSIQNAYLKAIQLSDHFVYIENQFFITSTTVNDVKIENRIGDALVHRIIRAHREKTKWKACIVIPLLPGFSFPVDHSDASAIRIILECQNRTISRGPNSIFSRLRKEGIDPEDYIAVFSLRTWAKFKGDVLTTEQVYIHGKVCIVDDRLAIIGSANINERSQRGDRDSELATIIRDTDMIDGIMDGKPYKVGRFAHTLRVRLMREHVGIDVDSVDQEAPTDKEPTTPKPEAEQEPWDPDVEETRGAPGGVTYVEAEHEHAGSMAKQASVTAKQVGRGANELIHAKLTGPHDGGASKAIPLPHAHSEEDLEEEREEGNAGAGDGFASHSVPTMEEKIVQEKFVDKQTEEFSSSSSREEHEDGTQTSRPSKTRTLEVQGGENDDPDRTPAHSSTSLKKEDTLSRTHDSDEGDKAASSAQSAIRRHLGSKMGGSKWTVLAPRPEFGADDFEDPVSDAFWKDIWVSAAVFNTEVFRKVFHAVPDDLVTTWKQYTEFIVHHDRLNKPPKDESYPDPIGTIPSEQGDDKPGQERPQAEEIKSAVKNEEEDQSEYPAVDDERQNPSPHRVSFQDPPPSSQDKDTTKEKRPARPDEPFERWERDEMEKLLHQVCGHLVVYPNRFLEGEDIANNFLFNADRMLPLPIYD
ncbi:hypothetical protein BDV98DRAFT_565647 [Pterulicium gracile]|uniref:Phospholipase n=1 Tax=Pterulicium gracile TaxID=1884261 RepID=A0A5C3QKN5_9AGAR|nr:hypothetical protein BDV98DRAFT_565647 [Pterula gracilis]